MKKTTFTFVAFAFGMGVALAQTAPQANDNAAAKEQTIAIDRMSNPVAEAGRRSLKVEELPAAVQEQLKKEEYATYQVISVTEVQPQAKEGQEAVVQYEVALAESAAATEPALVVFFDEKGQLIAPQENAVESESGE